jgi:hypothetical protein
MADNKPQRTQKTKPHGVNPDTGKPYKPMEIPVPKRGDFEKVLKRATKDSASKEAKH